MKTIFNALIAVIFMAFSVMTLDAQSLPEPRSSIDLSHLTDISGDLASINHWKPEIPELMPAPVVAGAMNVEEEIDLSYIPDMIEHASSFIGLRYRRGGKTPAGFDCSGFTGYIFRQFGINLNSNSASQYKQGEAVHDGDLQPGDLVFFNGRAVSRTRVGHVGIVVSVNDDGTFRFIHSAISSGITVSESTEPYYKRRYIGARRVH